MPANHLTRMSDGLLHTANLRLCTGHTVFFDLQNYKLHVDFKLLRMMFYRQVL